MQKLTQLLFILFMLILSFNINADTPWDYAKGEQSISISFIDDRFDRVWEGSKEASIPKVTQQNTWLNYSHGITDDILLSATFGYTQTSWEKNDSSFNGIADSSLSIKYQLLNEFIDESIASVSIKLTGIIKGTYDRAYAQNPHSPGDKSNGGEISLQIGKFLHDNFAAYLDIGYKILIDNVPDDIVANIGIYYSINKSFGINALYAVKHALDGTDIKGNGFDPNFFHQTKEERQWLELSIDYTFLPAHTFSFGSAQVIKGRNSGKSRIFFIGYRYSIF